MTTTVQPRLNIHRLFATLYSGPCGHMLYALKRVQEGAKSACCINRVSGQDTVSERKAQLWFDLLELETSTSEMCIGQVAHLGAVRSYCARWLKTICNRQNIILQELWGYQTVPWGALACTWLCVYPVKVGTPPADRKVAPAP